MPSETPAAPRSSAAADAPPVHDPAARDHGQIGVDGGDHLREQCHRADLAQRCGHLGSHERASVAARLAALGDHGVRTCRDRLHGLLRRRHHREERRARRARELDRGSGILERRDHRGPGRERGLEQLEARRGRVGRRRLLWQAELGAEGSEQRDDALALAGRRARRRELHVRADRRSPAPRDRGTRGLARCVEAHAAQAEHTEPSGTRDLGHELAGCSGRPPCRRAGSDGECPGDRSGVPRRVQSASARPCRTI